ncbi:hypothetical protein BOTNAR_0276g00030 [Botryotinia narcissicola]|uniref:Uncharacterized protein n=1 Tax=Botryotinia narcissicola TaxID=278944 RepID=A0A4Z1IBE3_9HELO|nr:hypothetical protein BOTNAR_0276g00030 [Botryotinia narcissicola]
MEKRASSAKNQQDNATTELGSTYLENLQAGTSNGALQTSLEFVSVIMMPIFEEALVMRFRDKRWK